MWLGATNRSISPVIIPPPFGSLRFHPGYYGSFDYAGGVSATRFANGDHGIINATTTTLIQGQPPDNLMGFAFIQNWRGIDKGTVAPSYDWSTTDLYANACAAKGKQYWIWLVPTNFVASGQSITTGSKCCPDWLINSQGLAGSMGNYSPLGSGVFPKWYNAPIATAFTAFLQAAITRYQGDPFCEGIALGIGTANASFNGVDNLGTKNPQINYNTGYSDTGMISAYKGFMTSFRLASPTLNFWVTTDYLFNMGGSSSYTGQDVQWTGMFQSAIANQCAFGGPDSWTRNWIYPQLPFTSTGQNAYAASTNPSYFRSVYSDGIFRGWRGPTPGVGLGFRGQILYCGCQELTEMGGYIGQFSAADVMSWRGAALDNVHYQFFDVNYAQSGNYGTDPGVTPGAPKAPNTLWLGTTTYDASFGQSVYRFIQGAGPTNTVNPYS